ncbi:MAG: Crp/Fnr family transcriptional regulator [Gemmataceae bacterium]
MTEPVPPSELANHPFIQGLEDRHRVLLASGARNFTASAGDYLAREGDPAHAFYLVQFGHVEIGSHLAERGATPIQTVGPGEVVGWSWLLPPYHWQFDARAVDAVSGLAFDADWLREQCERDHEFGYQLLKQLLIVVGRRLAAARIQRFDIYK